MTPGSLDAADRFLNVTRLTSDVSTIPLWECNECGALTADALRHSNWHDQLNGRGDD